MRRQAGISPPPSSKSTCQPGSKLGSRATDLPDTTAFVSGDGRGPGKHLAGQLTRRAARGHGEARKPGTLDTRTGVIPIRLDITYHASVTAAAAAVPDTSLLKTDLWQGAGRRRLDGRTVTAIATMLAGAVIGGELIPAPPIFASRWSLCWTRSSWAR